MTSSPNSIYCSSGFYHDPSAGWYYSTRDGLYYKFENGNYVLFNEYTPSPSSKDITSQEGESEAPRQMNALPDEPVYGKLARCLHTSNNFCFV